MLKQLNIFNNTSNFVQPSVGATDLNLNQAPLPRLAFGFVGGALAALTIAVGVVLPARVGPGGQQLPLRLASQAISAPTSGAGTITSITVVAARQPGSSTSALRMVEAAPSPGVSGETTSSPILRISTAAR
jgi:hypothetical protein